MKLPGKRSKRRRGLAIPMTLFFVMIAFFAASTLLVRSHYEAQATIMDTVSIQREALARSALATGMAMLESHGTNEYFTTFSLAGPGGMEARVWLEQEGDDLFRMYAEVKGGMGRPYLAQKVLRKKPRLSAIDMVHLLDGDIQTPDELKYRVVGSNDWVSLPNTKSSMMWVEVDRRGNVVSNYFPVLETGESPHLPDGFVERLVAKNNELINEGRIEHGFFKKASLAIEENWELNINKALDVGVNTGNAGFAPVTNSGIPQTAGFSQGTIQLENNPDLIRPARIVADALTQGAAIEHYSQESGKWATVELDFSKEPSGGIPGPAASDGKGLYFPILKPGPDSLRRYDFQSKGWSEVPPPPALTGSGKTRHLLDVEVDDDGRIYAHHGDDGQYGLSVFDPNTESWERLPSPKGIYIEASGKESTVTDNPSDWGNLEVDDQGNVYVIWRAKGSTEVVNHLAKNEPGSGGSFVGAGTPKPGNGGDAMKLPPAFQEPSAEFQNSGGTKPNAGAYGGSPGGGSPAYGGDTVTGGTTKPGNAGLVGNTGVAGSPGDAGNSKNVGTIGSGGFDTGFPTLGLGAEPASDMILKLSDGKWTAIRPPLQPSQTLGSITAGTDGRLVLHAVTSGADLLIGIKPDGTLEPPSTVPGERGEAALYFGIDSGAQTIPGQFSFQETADF